MKTLLVGINSKFIHSNLAVRYLKAYTKELDFECEIKEYSINDQKERIVEDILSQKAELVCFSCYIWNIEYVTSIATLVKLVHPSIEILYGGPEVTYDAKGFLEREVGEYIIEGEGEETFWHFIQWKLSARTMEKKEQEKELASIQGLYYKKEEKVYYHGARALMDINKVKFPYEETENLENKIVYYEASRGCPFNCKYCLSSTTHGVRFLNLERVKQDLKKLIDKKVRLIKFVDRTFNCNSKFAMEIWSFLINTPSQTTFHFEISADLLKAEEIELLSKAPKGKFQFEVGVQTTNPTILNNINRYVNFTTIKEKVFQLEQTRNIKQHLDLIAGLPGEDFHSFKQSFNDIYKIEPEEIQLGFLKLLKGSSMREEAEKWGMVYAPYPPYEILKTKHISYEALMQLKKIEKLVDKYYNSQKFNTILQYFIILFSTPFDFYESLASFWERKGYFQRNISSVDYYKIFLEFNEEELGKNNEFLEEVIKYDYLRHNKKKWLPAFLPRYIEKEKEKSLKGTLKEQQFIEKAEQVHIEKFKVDILHYIAHNEIRKQEQYLGYFFNTENQVLDLTPLLEID